ncbi:MAG: hypothetical protein R3F56_17845 [Planctomycetota bacterium]
MRRILVDLDSRQTAELARGPFGWITFAPGATLIALGVVIYAMPALLVMMVSGACIAAGTLLLLIAWRLRRLR